jgi:hypothetical protein
MAGEADVQVDSSTATLEPAVEPKVIDHDSPLPEGTKVETAERFKALLDDRKSMKDRLAGYEAFGSPEEIAALRTRVQNIDALHDRVERMEARREEGTPKSETQKEAEQQLALAKKQLRSIDPAIESGEWAGAILREELVGLEQEATDAQTALMKANGVPITQENMDLYGSFIAATIKASTKLKRLYRHDPEAAVTEGWKELQGRFKTGTVSTRAADAKVQEGKEKLAGLPKPHGGGGGPGPSTHTEPPKTSAEGVKRALAILRG